MKHKYNVNIKEKAAELGVCTDAIYKRIRAGWDIDDAVSVPFIPQKERCVEHKRKYDADIKMAAEKLGIHTHTIYLRLSKGWPLEKAISTPNCRRKIKPLPAFNCDALNNSLARLNNAIDRILDLKTEKRKIVLNQAGTDLRKLPDHFTGLNQWENQKIESFTGGVKCYILNHVNEKKKEFKYNIVSTDGRSLATNDKQKFMDFLRYI